MEKTVRELCLICRGERWIPRTSDPARSQPCPHCQGRGWVVIAPACLEAEPPAAGAAEARGASAGSPGA